MIQKQLKKRLFTTTLLLCSLYSATLANAQQPSILKDIPTKFGMSMDAAFDSVRSNFLCWDDDSEGILHPHLKRVRIGNVQAYNTSWTCALSGESGKLNRLTITTLSPSDLDCSKNPNDGEYTVDDWMAVCDKLDSELKKHGKVEGAMHMVWKIAKNKLTSWLSKGNLWMTCE